MQSHERDILDEQGQRLGQLRIHTAGAFVPVGQMQYSIDLLDRDGNSLGQIEHLRHMTRIRWEGLRPFQYPGNLAQREAVELAGELLRQHAWRPHIVDIVNDFARQHWHEPARAL